jgi:hypothetical protein
MFLELSVHIVAYFLSARTVKPTEKAVARERLRSRHVLAPTDTHVTTEELLEEVFSVRSLPRLYNEGQLPLAVSPSPSRESVDSLQADSQLTVVEIGSWGRGQFGNPEERERQQLEAATKQRQWGPWPRTSVCVW